MSQSRFRTSLFQGYDRRAVDELVARVSSSLASGADAASLCDPSGLGQQWFGYARSDVRWLLTAVRRDAADEPARRRRGTWLAGQLAVCAAILGVAALVGALFGAGVLASALVVLLVVLQPLLGARGYRALVLRVRIDPDARVDFHVRSMLRKWTFVGVLAILGGYAHEGVSSIYLTVGHSSGGWFLWVEAGVLVVVGTVAFRRVVRAPSDRLYRQLGHLVAMAGAILPRSRRERVVFAAGAITAGVTEELIFRGFGIAYLRWARPGIGDLAIVLVVGIAFGFVHLYQGARGVLLTSLVGIVFTWVTLLSGSLVPAIILHVFLDLRLVLVPDAVLDEACERALGDPRAFVAAGAATRLAS